ncbi:MAG: hypothetical protein JO192_04320, partial [Candidatus Eremiobacteraeota bacterium]|nr:hypothetical protein [Candidatus Eremiobacteraeota bacterium]
MRAVTLFLGPAGSGKSRALRERLASAAGPVQTADGLEKLDAAAIAQLVGEIERSDGDVRWLLASRSRSGLPIASWSACGRLTVVGPRELSVAGAPDWTQGWAVAVALQSRELVYAFLEERAYSDLSPDKLALLEAA